VIVVDSNVIAYLYLPSEYTKRVELLFDRQPDWAAPVLWRSEFRNILTGYLRRGTLSFEQSYSVQRDAEDLLSGSEYDVDSLSVLRLVQESDCSAYDCEYVALAMMLNTRLVTMDKQILRAFPAIAAPVTAA
jgi:predicted nucleic acid-binding protein